MMTIKELTEQELIICIEEPNAERAFYFLEKQICRIVSDYLAESIEENIQLLNTIVGFKKLDYFQILYKDKNICVCYLEVVE